MCKWIQFESGLWWALCIVKRGIWDRYGEMFLFLVFIKKYKKFLLEVVKKL